MLYRELKLAGAFIIEPERFEDARGFFALIWSRSSFKERGLEPELAECNLSFNCKRGTLRGMHYQATPHEQVKLVRCTRGSIYDVIIDLRAASPTFKEWVGVELTADNYRMLYIPKGFGHGFQTLQDETEVFYQMSEVYVPESGGGVRWNDPAFDIAWPQPDGAIINQRDATYPDFAFPGQLQQREFKR
jgi:dTDP-4-dehydrorhamnose 3,5-epimerase